MKIFIFFYLNFFTKTTQYACDEMKTEGFLFQQVLYFLYLLTDVKLK